MAQRIGILVICDNKVGLEGQVVVRNFVGGGGVGFGNGWYGRKEMRRRKRQGMKMKREEREGNLGNREERQKQRH